MSQEPTTYRERGLFSTSEIAHIFQAPVSRIRQIIDNGQIVAADLPLSSQRRVARVELVRFIESMPNNEPLYDRLNELEARRDSKDKPKGSHAPDIEFGVESKKSSRKRKSS